MHLKCYSNAIALKMITKGNMHAQTPTCTLRAAWLASGIDKLPIDRGQDGSGNANMP